MAKRIAMTCRRHTLLCSTSIALLALLAIFTWTGSVPAELAPEAMKARDRYVTRTITALLAQQHLSNHALDDEISIRTFQTFLKQLDPMKVYFYQSDVDEFAQSRTQLDDQIRSGDISFAYKVFNRFLQRLDERVAMIPKLLAEKHDFTVKEDLLTDPDAATYPKTPEEAEDRWRKRIKYDLLSLKEEAISEQEKAEANNKLGEKAAAAAVESVPESPTPVPLRIEDSAEKDPIARLTRRYSSYAKRMHQYNADDLLEIYLTSMTTSFDPHTTYMSPTTLENFNISMELKLDGIGAALTLVDGYTVVNRIIPGGAADKQGDLKPEDRIISVAQDDTGEFVDVVDMRLNDVVQLIRGKAGSVVRLLVKSGDGGESKTVRIVRDRIELKDSEAKGTIIEAPELQGGQKANGSPYRVGVIKLPSFYMDMAAARQGFANFKSTTRDVRRILTDFRRQGVDAVILDLRFNGGGSLTEAIQLTGLFIDVGPVVQVKANDRVQKYPDTESGTAWDGPLVVVTNKFSASASEILAGAIQDYHRGIIVGDRTTHGKGTVQNLLDLSEKLYPNMDNVPNLGALKITMQQFYRPDGDSTQKRGVLSDVPLPSTTNEMDIGEADLDYAVQFDHVELAPHATYGQVTPAIVGQLNERSTLRRDKSEDFARELRRIERYKEQKDRKFVSLNEEEFFARRKELDAEKEDEKNFKEIDNSDDVVFDLKDFYDKELLNITLDYVSLLNQPAIAAQR